MLLESVKTSVSINGFFVLARNIEKFLARYVFNLAIWNHDEVYKVSLLGSATPIKYRENYLLVCSGHQIRGVDPQDISILTVDGRYAVTSSGYVMPNIAPGGAEYDLQDITVLNFTDACLDHTDLREKFFSFSSTPPDCTNEAVVAVLNFGFPSRDQVYELHEKNHIGSRLRATILKPHAQPNDTTLLHLKPLKKLNFDPDGLSGGLNFVIQSIGGDNFAFFAGVTVRAGERDVYIVKSGYIKLLLDEALKCD